MKWVLAGAAVFVLSVLAIAAIFIMRSFVFNPNRGNTNAVASQSHDSTSAEKAAEDTSNSPNSSLLASQVDLVGKWTGTYGVSNNPATLTVSEHKDGKFGGVIEQGGIRVAFTGTLDPQSRRVTMKETQVLTGSGWSLGENIGVISADGRSMSGTGSDATGRQFGISYQWSFSR